MPSQMPLLASGECESSSQLRGDAKIALEPQNNLQLRFPSPHPTTPLASTWAERTHACSAFWSPFTEMESLEGKWGRSGYSGRPPIASPQLPPSPLSQRRLMGNFHHSLQEALLFSSSQDEVGQRVKRQQAISVQPWLVSYLGQGEQKMSASWQAEGRVKKEHSTKRHGQARNRAISGLWPASCIWSDGSSAILA